MTSTQLQRNRGIARNATHATRRKTKPKPVVETMRQKTADPRSEFNDEEWHQMVATAAYYRAQARGFDEGSSEYDWYEAEAELRARLARAEEDTEPGPDSGASLADIERQNE